MDMPKPIKTPAELLAFGFWLLAFKSGEYPFAKVALIHLSALTAGYFLSWQKVTKNRRSYIRPLRFAPGFPRSGLAPGRTALQAPSWGPALDGHPCPSPPSARPPFGLLKSQLAVTELLRA